MYMILGDVAVEKGFGMAGWRSGRREIDASVKKQTWLV
jgi:hypothetical protein